MTPTDDQVHYMVELLRAAKCPEPKCSDGSIVTTGPDPQNDACEWCYQRHQTIEAFGAVRPSRPESCKHGKPLTMYDGGPTSADCVECFKEVFAHQSGTKSPSCGCTPERWDPKCPEHGLESPIVKARHEALDRLNAIEQRYLDSYEFTDGETFEHTPDENDRAMIEDAIAGLHADEEFVTAWAAWRGLCGPDPAFPQVGRESSGADAIAAERVRQMEVEKWNTDHDDDHEDASLTHAALCYARLATFQIEDKPYAPILRAGAPIDWPWTPDSYKPKDARRNLVRAGALIAAEIDRLDRADKSQSVAGKKPERCATGCYNLTPGATLCQVCGGDFWHAIGKKP